MTSESMDSLDECSFSQVADAFLETHREGKAPSIEELAESFPHLASEIRQKLPAMKMLEGTIGQGKYPKVDPEQPVAGCYLGEEIGRGACGIVYRATQPALNRKVAVKVIRIRSETMRRFEVERQAMARLDHPHIVPVYAFEQSDAQAYLVMKLIEGFSFEQLLRGDCDHFGTYLLSSLRDDWKRFAEVARDIACALEHAHKNNLVHRDIKPANLMLDRQGDVWITDFGLVKTFDLSQSLSATGDLIGTPRYMSPEQLRGTCDARSDIYSLGLSLFELATGTKARQSSKLLTEQVLQNIDSPSQHNPKIPDSLVAIIEKASAFAPEDRFQSASELKNVLQRFIDDQVPDRRKGRRKPDEVFRRESRKNMALLGGAAVLVGGIAYFAVMPNQRPVAGPADPVRDRGETLLVASVSEVQGAEPAKNTTKTRKRPNQSVGLSGDESKALASGLDALFRGIETGELSDKDITSIAQRYRDSNLATAGRVSRIRVLFEKSGLQLEEKARAIKATSKLARLTAAGRLRETKVFDLTRPLVDGNALTRTELEQLVVADNELRSWLTFIEREIENYSLPQTDLSNELESLFSKLPNYDSTRSVEPERPLNRERIRNAIDRLPDQLRDKVRAGLEGMNNER